MRELTRYKSVQVDGLQIFYREAGPPAATTILLLHGFPSTSRMYEPLFQRLADRYHLIAPDYPGFGHSDAPPSDKFAYTFDNLATIVDHFAQSVHATRWSRRYAARNGPSRTCQGTHHSKCDLARRRLGSAMGYAQGVLE